MINPAQKIPAMGKAQAEEFLPFITAIYQVHPKRDQPQQLGTGVFLSIGDRHFLLTAAHVLDANADSTIYCVIDNELAAIEAPSMKSKLPKGAKREDDPIVHEGYEVIRTSWKTEHGKRWHSQLNQKDKASLKRLHKYFANNRNLTSTIRNSFGFHYCADPLREPIAEYRHDHGDIFTGRHSANIFYPFAEEIRARAMMQAASPKQARKLWDKGVTEAEIRTAAVELYSQYKEPLEAFQAVANAFLIPTVKKLKPASKTFNVRRPTKFRRMKPILFVEEPA